MVKIKGLSYSVSGNKILEKVNCEFHCGRITGIIGINGSGKSTLLKHIYRALPSRETVFLNDIPVERFSAREYAKKAAVVLQEGLDIQPDFKVADIVVMGRYAHKKLTESYTARDSEFVAGALRFVEMQGAEERLFLTLSGGEKQRVLLARALCQDTSLLVLDEPANHLDIRQQLCLMEILTCLRKTTIIALHDLNLAAMYCDRLILMHNGNVMGTGSPSEIITKQNLLHYFGVDAKVAVDNTGRPAVSIKKPRG